MDFSQSFSALNEKLKPRCSASETLHSSLNRLEDRELASLRRKDASRRPSVLPPQPAAGGTDEEQTDVGSDSLEEDDYLPVTTCLLSELNLKDFSDDSSSNKSEEKDGVGELSDGDSLPPTPEGGTRLQRDCSDSGLPDVIRIGRPLSRRMTVGHVSQSLKEVRREVEISRRRSIKLKAQVDILKEKRDGSAWSRNRERVTEEVLSVLRLLYPLLEAEQTILEPPEGEKRLDGALDQLQKLARRLAVSRTDKQKSKNSGGKRSEDSAILQQALRDRDEAVEKKKAMEAELLRSRTEMMLLNNQVLEAAQKRLEMSLEVEAWKEDFQLLLHQQVQNQQLAEQNQKKPYRTLGILRRSNRPPIERPSNFPINSAPTTRTAAPAAPGTPIAPPTANNQPNWMDKLRRGKTSRQGEQHPSAHHSQSRRADGGFQVISLE